MSHLSTLSTLSTLLWVTFSASVIASGESGCSDQWRSIDSYKLAREAQTSIAYQCTESPCPPHSVLQQRAVMAARTMALAEIRVAVASMVIQEVSMESGRVSDQTTLYAAGQVHDIVTCKRIEGDTVRVRAFGEIRDSGQ
ncbi:MAG: hypothetical protein HN842_00150 [Gammaproteobacteria bacterium]|jgi:hypothetical protein|nr:hypothetical protein [Gammaproteobacteria bacterium]MBT7306591.1 hypothetical protein [Gammaproteobacteria bacterium]